MDVIICFFIVNVLAFYLYCNDKHRATYGYWRIPEWVLFMIAFAGGSFGALMAMWLFRHKTCKRLFSIGVPVLLLVHSVILFLMGYPWNLLPDIMI